MRHFDKKNYNEVHHLSPDITSRFTKKITIKKTAVSWKNFLDASNMGVQFTSQSENFTFPNFEPLLYYLYGNIFRKYAVMLYSFIKANLTRKMGS